MSHPSVSRTGWGLDVHPLDGAPPLLLGGIEVSGEVGVSATSDGDVLAHAVIDAILGAAVLGDLGEHFPGTDPAWAGADSMDLLRRVVAMVGERGWAVTHVDVTVVAESVRVAPHRQRIRSSLAAVLGMSEAAVSVKATTTDGLGVIGRDQGLAAVAVATIGPLP